MKKKSFGQGRRSMLDLIIMKIRFNKISKLIPRGVKILDLGCGYEGEFLVSIEKNISLGFGVDLSVNRNLNPSLPKIKLIQGRVDEKLPFKNDSFDLVTALAIIEHVDNPEKMLKEVMRVLKPDGLALLTTPPLISKPILDFMAWLGIISKEEISDHKRYYTKRSFLKAMKTIGFKEVSIKYFGIMGLNIVGKGVK